MIGRLWAMIKARPLMWGVIAVVVVLLVLFLARRRAPQTTVEGGESENVRLAEIAAQAQGNQVQAAMIAAQSQNAAGVEIARLNANYGFEALKLSEGYAHEKAILDAHAIEVVSTLQAQAQSSQLAAVKEIQLAGIAADAARDIESQETQRIYAQAQALAQYNMIASQPQGLFGGKKPIAPLIAPDFNWSNAA